MTVYTFKVDPGKKITVRENAAVVPGDYVASLPAGQMFSGDLVRNTPTEKWVCLTTVHPGKYVAITYKGETFASVVGGTLPPPDVNPPPPAQVDPTLFGVLAKIGLDPHGKLQVVVELPGNIEIGEVWIGNDKYTPA